MSILIALLSAGCHLGAVDTGSAGEAAYAEANHGGDCVVLVHGLGRTAGSMKGIQRALEQQGYLVWNQSYPSRRHSIAALADTFVAQGVDACHAAGAERIHFVTHSMGGILVRHYLQRRHLDEQGRVVMLAPPNRGSELTDWFSRQFWYRWILGPAAMELGTGPESTPNSLRPVAGSIGVIAGTGTSPPWMGWLFDGPNDGKVSVASARLDEMVDFLVVDRGHTVIASADAVIDQVSAFLANGEFQRHRSSVARRSQFLGRLLGL